MTLHEILTIITCLTSTVTMFMVGVAILPHFKNGLAIVRDAVLWASLVVIIIVMGWVGIQQFMSRGGSQAEAESVETETVPVRSHR